MGLPPSLYHLDLEQSSLCTQIYERLGTPYFAFCGTGIQAGVCTFNDRSRCYN